MTLSFFNVLATWAVVCTLHLVGAQNELLPHVRSVELDLKFVQDLPVILVAWEVENARNVSIKVVQSNRSLLQKSVESSDSSTNISLSTKHLELLTSNCNVAVLFWAHNEAGSSKIENRSITLNYLQNVSVYRNKQRVYLRCHLANADITVGCQVDIKAVGTSKTSVLHIDFLISNASLWLPEQYNDHYTITVVAVNAETTRLESYVYRHTMDVIPSHSTSSSSSDGIECHSVLMIILLSAGGVIIILLVFIIAALCIIKKRRVGLQPAKHNQFRRVTPIIGHLPSPAGTLSVPVVHCQLTKKNNKNDEDVVQQLNGTDKTKLPPKKYENFPPKKADGYEELQLMQLNQSPRDDKKAELGYEKLEKSRREPLVDSTTEDGYEKPLPSLNVSKTAEGYEKLVLSTTQQQQAGVKKADAYEKLFATSDPAKTIVMQPNPAYKLRTT